MTRLQEATELLQGVSNALCSKDYEALRFYPMLIEDWLKKQPKKKKKGKVESNG